MKNLTKFCEGLNCPIKESCKRFTEIPKEGRYEVFTEIPGRFCDAVNGRNPYKPLKVWVCDKFKK